MRSQLAIAMGLAVRFGSDHTREPGTSELRVSRTLPEGASFLLCILNSTQICSNVFAPSPAGKKSTRVKVADLTHFPYRPPTYLLPETA